MNKERWQRLLQSLGLSSDLETHERLVAAYSQKHRKYHNVVHVEDCLAKLDDARHLAEAMGEIEIALWFHDAVYEPVAAGNEAKSADWARDFLLQRSADEALAGRVHDLILATLHDGRATSQDAKLLVDIDLSILGAEDADYQRFEAAIRQEYRWVPSFVYRKKRREILESFLERDRIYNHDEFRARYEDRARSNLEGAIKAL